MSITYLTTITHTQTLLSALIAGFAFLQFRRRKPVTKLIGAAFAIGCIANSVTLILFLCGFGKHSNTVLSVYETGNFSIICLIFNIALNGKYFKAIFVLFILFLLFSIYNFFFVQRSGSLNTLTYAVGSIFIMVLCVLYFYRLMEDLPEPAITHMPMFWFASAFLIYCAGTLILFIVQSYLVNVMKDDMITYWFFHNSISIVEHFLVLIGLWWDYKNYKTLVKASN
jgi:hypothetical protein